MLYLLEIYLHNAKEETKKNPGLCKTQTSEINSDRDVYIDTMMGVLVLCCEMLLSLLEYNVLAAENEVFAILHVYFVVEANLSISFQFRCGGVMGKYAAGGELKSPTTG